MENKIYLDNVRFHKESLRSNQRLKEAKEATKWKCDVLSLTGPRNGRLSVEKLEKSK
jgi:hypothetical protein